jgi:cell division protein FtsB
VRPVGSGLRDAAFAGCLAVVLGVGVVGVLLLNTAMQQQSDRIAVQHQRMAALLQQAQDLRTRIDLLSTPAALAARAHRLRLRPVEHMRFVAVSPSRPATARAHAG